jgi:hypothetical protein
MDKKGMDKKSRSRSKGDKMSPLLFFFMVGGQSSLLKLTGVYFCYKIVLQVFFADYIFLMVWSAFLTEWGQNGDKMG